MRTATRKWLHGIYWRLFRPDLVGVYGGSFVKMWRYRLWHPHVYATVKKICLEQMEKAITELDDKAREAMSEPGSNQLERDSTVQESPYMIIFDEAGEVTPEMFEPKCPINK